MFGLVKLFKRDREKTKDTAKERLRMVIVHDRGDESRGLLKNLKKELFEVLSKYMEIEDTELDIKLTEVKNDEDGAMVPALIANIPIKKLKAN